MPGQERVCPSVTSPCWRAEHSCRLTATGPEAQHVGQHAGKMPGRWRRAWLSFASHSADMLIRKPPDPWSCMSASLQAFVGGDHGQSPSPPNSPNSIKTKSVLSTPPCKRQRSAFLECPHLSHHHQPLKPPRLKTVSIPHSQLLFFLQISHFLIEM